MNCCSGDEGESLIELILNHEGEDVTVVVPLHVGNVLLNDPDAAKAFLLQLREDNSEIVTENLNVNSNVVATCSTMNAIEDPVENTEKTNKSNRLIWTSKKPSCQDTEGTEFFLKLRKEYSDKFDDRKTIKGQIWLLIATKMNEAGFYVGEGRDAIEKCRIKFANMQKQYLQHIRHLNTTGEGKKSEPPFFSMLHEIIGKKDKVNPTHLQDSLDDPRTKNEDSEVASGSTSDENDSQCKSDIENRFRGKQSVRPNSANSLLVNLMRKQHEESVALRQEEFKQITNLMETQNQQRERFLSQLDRLIDLKTNKRKRSNSDSD